MSNSFSKTPNQKLPEGERIPYGASSFGTGLVWILIIAAVIAAGGVLVWQQLVSEKKPISEISRDCVYDEECIGFSKTEDCDCACYNKNSIASETEGLCDCSIQLACRCMNNKCEEGLPKRAMNNMIVSDLMQIRVAAEYINDYDEEGYANVSCQDEDIRIICDDVKKFIGVEPVIYQSQEQYCAYVKLLTEENVESRYYCVDTSFVGRETSVDPGESSYCDGVTFICPLGKIYTGNVEF